MLLVIHEVTEKTGVRFGCLVQTFSYVLPSPIYSECPSHGTGTQLFRKGSIFTYHEPLKWSQVLVILILIYASSRIEHK